MKTAVYTGALLSVLLTAGLAVFSGLGVKKGRGGFGPGITAGIILGTLVGGASTVGTAQLAYQYGMSAWWFTLGGGLACLVLALWFVKPLRAEKAHTLLGMIADEYGRRAGLLSSVLNTTGTFLSIISQLLSASAVVAVLFPRAGLPAAVALSAGLMVLYVVFGGTKGAGMVGVLKLSLLSCAMLACGVLAVRKVGGAGEFLRLVRAMEAENGVAYLSLFARGFRRDAGAGLSMILGVLTTQTYAMAVLGGRTDRTAAAGSLASAVLILPIGIFGILVGLYMRSVTDPAVFMAKNALTEFILRYSGLPPLVSGAILGTLFIASVGTGAGLALGTAAILRRDVLSRFVRRPLSPVAEDRVDRLLIAAVLALGSLLSSGALGDTILNFSFMSMGLRGATVFVPLCFLLWKKGRVAGSWAVAAIAAGPAVCLLFGIVPALNALLGGWDALFPGVAAALVIMLCGWYHNNAKKRGPLSDR